MGIEIDEVKDDVLILKDRSAVIVIEIGRDLLQDQYQIINSLSPQAKNEDCTKTQICLLGKTNTNEEFTLSDIEINRFLPKDLHI